MENSYNGACSGTLLLLQCFWRYIANLVARARFMSSKEFKFYIAM